MEKKLEKPNHKKEPTSFLDNLTPELSEFLSLLVRSTVGGVIGIVLTALFGIVIVAVIVVSFFIDRANAPHLLNNVLTLVSSAFTAVLGYFLGLSRSKE